MKVVVVMTYWNRPYQLKVTLQSIAKSKHNDFEVVVVDDASEEEIKLESYGYPITVLEIEAKEKKWTNPEPAYNTGLSYAMTLNPDVIIIQNAECYHVGDVISYATRVTDTSYIAFGCFSLDQKNTFAPHDINELIEKNKRRAQFNGDLAWYNHSIYRPNAFDFCAAMTVKSMKTLNGYDERFSVGHSYGDNYLIERVIMLGLQIEIPERPFVVHQWHYEKDLPAHFIRLDAINKLLLLKLREDPNYRAKHIYTKDL